MPRLDFQILVDQRSRHFFGEDIERERAACFQIGHHFETPREDVGRRSGAPHIERAVRVWFRRFKDATVAQEDGQRKMPTDQVGEISFDLSLSTYASL